MTNQNLNQVFIKMSSPTICGIKPASLFTVNGKKFSIKIFQDWKRFASKNGLSIAALKTVSNVVLIFIYNFDWIKKIIGETSTQLYLRSKGYSFVSEAKKTLADLFCRLKNQKNFPHEIGVFLGYPIEDVIKFEEKKGKFCKYCGYWKSYCNPEEAKKCCMRYKQCSQMCKQWFDEGFSLPQIIKKYKEMTRQVA